MRDKKFSSRHLMATAALCALAALTSGCKTASSTDPTLSYNMVTPPPSGDWRREAEVYGERYRADPRDAEAAIRYAQALRALGQRAQAVAVLERSSIQHSRNRAVLGAYGRALADVGNYEQALEVLARAHTPDQPDWRILSVEGAVLDQMGRHDDARRYYETALKIVPEEPSVLSNLGLSYALSKDLPSVPRRPCARQPHGRRPTRACGRTSRSWSGCRAASRRPSRSPAPTCRPTKPPPTSPTCGRCCRNQNGFNRPPRRG